MNAVILAGGAGTRLRPLTFRKPKPMLPVANRPLMEHIVRLLRRHGFRQIAATLQYMPEAIRSYFQDGSGWGVSLCYSIEDEPLGTAGGVKRLEDHLDERFIIISGDALTDFDLTELLAFHCRKRAAVTMALRRVEDPRQFGVVELDSHGRVVRFLEKPSREQVFSNLVNTGIYVIEREVLRYVPDGQFFDFSRDLFPLLLQSGERLFGYEMDGYWCDIGTPEGYIQANYDAVSGRVRVDMPGRLTEGGVWVGPGAIIEPGVDLQGPALIGAYAAISSGTRVGPMTVIGPGCAVGARASLRNTVIWGGAYIGAGAHVTGLVAHDAPGLLAAHDYSVLAEHIGAEAPANRLVAAGAGDVVRPW